MAKYIDSSNPVDINKVEELFNAGYKEAEEDAKKEADYLLEEIKHYKETSYDDLKKEVEQRFTGYLTEEIEKAQNEPNSSYVIEQISNVIWHDLEKIKDKGKRLQEARKIAENMPFEEKMKIFTKRRTEILNENLEDELKRVLKTDILFDLMTEEQVKQYVELYYILCLKGSLLNAKTKAMIKSEKELDKNGRIFYNTKQGLNFDLVGLSAAVYENEKITNIRKIDRMESEKKDESEKNLKDLGGILFTSGFIGLTSGTILAGIANGLSDGRISLEMIPIATGVILACFGVSRLSEFIKDQKKVAEAKKFGLYDMIVDHLKAYGEFKNYEDELKESYEVEGGMAL